MRIKGKLDELKADPRYQFLFSGMLVGDTMADFIGKNLSYCPARANRFRSSTCRACRPTFTSTVVAVLSRLVFDFAIWGREEKTRPVLLVCEEAHR